MKANLKNANFRINFRINKALLPFSWIYGLGVWGRNKLFDWGILPVEEFSVPVISVGNITVGGTGKTPHTEYLIRLLSRKYKVAVLSRGYKRQTEDFVLADDDATVDTIGDEPLQIYRKFPDVVVAVDADRRRGIKKLLNLPDDLKPEVILLDDSFQHRYVKPSLSILLTNSLQMINEDYLLPAGRLREPAANHVRADMIVCTKCDESFEGIDYQAVRDKLHLHPKQQLFFSAYSYKRGLLPIFTDIEHLKKESIERFKKDAYSFMLISGLANPEDLINYLKNYTFNLHIFIYPDHHAFTIENFINIKEAFLQMNNYRKIIIVSEKDAMRLADNPYFPQDLQACIYYLPIEVVFHNEELFTQKIEEHVANFKRNRIMA
ncbi:tetraacyldisaccharide 4'-kinase [Bacteroidia bacterium]|nr:tetraacyldisaccharide 4'-kinase [Bacteroidia bacterium]